MVSYRKFPLTFLFLFILRKLDHAIQDPGLCSMEEQRSPLPVVVNNPRGQYACKATQIKFSVNLNSQKKHTIILVATQEVTMVRSGFFSQQPYILLFVLLSTFSELDILLAVSTVSELLTRL